MISFNLGLSKGSDYATLRVEEGKSSLPCIETHIHVHIQGHLRLRRPPRRSVRSVAALQLLSDIVLHHRFDYRSAVPLAGCHFLILITHFFILPFHHAIRRQETLSAGTGLSGAGVLPVGC